MKFQHKAFFKKFKAHIPQFIFFLFIVNVVISIFFLVAFAVNFFSIWRSQILFYIVGMGIGMLGIFIFYWAVMKGTTTIQKWGFGIGSFLIPILVFLISFSLINNPFDHLRLNAFVSGMLPLTFLYISMFFSFIGGLFIFSIYHYIELSPKIYKSFLS